MRYEYEGYVIKPHAQNPMSLVVATDGKGGKIPSCLDGMYTTVTMAKRDIDMYKSQKETDGKKPNKTVATG